MYMPEARTAVVAMTLTVRATHTESSPVGSTVLKNWLAAKATDPTRAISRHRLRVATDTTARTAGPEAVPETALKTPSRTAIGTGQRRRKKTRTNEVAPSARSTSTQSSEACSWSPATGSQATAEIPSMRTSRHAWLHSRSGGWYSSGAGRSTRQG